MQRGTRHTDHIQELSLIFPTGASTRVNFFRRTPRRTSAAYTQTKGSGKRNSWVEEAIQRASEPLGRTGTPGEEAKDKWRGNPKPSNF